MQRGAMPACTEQCCVSASGSDTYGSRVVPHGDASAKSGWLAWCSSESSGSDCRLGLFQEALLISLSALRPHIDEAVKTPSDS